MTDVTPEIKAICDRLKQKDPYRGVSPEMFVREIIDAAWCNSLRICYWRVKLDEAETRYLCLYRFDRAPLNAEILPWLQEIFLDGPIHEITIPGQPFREFYQGGNIYNGPISQAEVIANIIVNQAEARDDIELANDLMQIHKQDREN